MSPWREALAAGVVAGLAGTPTAAAEDLGRQVFLELAEPQCGICHALRHAGAAGEIGPDLDEVKPTEEQVAKAVSEGFEAMPAYRDVLSEEELAAVTAYVAAVAGR